MNDQNAALEKVKVPAILLIVTAVFSELMALWNIASGAFGFGGPSPEEIPAGMEGLMTFMQSFGIILGIVGLISATIILLGGLNMMKCRSYGLAMTASILCMVPMLNCCCILSLPIGIWALIVLRKPEVMAAFGRPAA